MKSLLATAPGKLVLCGEYAVLDGAPAISAAVDRRARVSLREHDDDIVVTTLGFQDGRYYYRLDESGLTPVREQEDLPLVRAAIQNAGLPLGTSLELELDTSSFFAGNIKLGFGSSAALTLALVGALARWSGSDESGNFRAEVIHRHFQGGRGSGVDVATSAEGGLIHYTCEVAQNSDGTTTHSYIRRRANWPTGLEAAVLSSGVSASTSAKLAKLDSQRRSSISDALVRDAEQAAAAWQSNDASEVLEATRRFASTLAEFSSAYDLDVYGSGHAMLAELAAQQGLVYKPCGAGGGDVGVVLGDAAARIARFVEQATEAGFVALDVGLGGQTGVKGLTVEWTHD